MSKTSKTTDGKTMFWCPGCNEFHWINDSWQITGDSENPTFAPSVLVGGSSQSGKPMRCHSFVRDGQIQFLGDCNHKLAGTTVPMIDMELLHDLES
jgi:hypothetical protein